MKKNSTEIAVSKINTVDKIRKEIIPNFASIDPYAKVILIQSVILLDDETFETIKSAYAELIAIAETDTDEWVKMTTKMFKNYPDLEPSDEFTIPTPCMKDPEFIDPFKPQKFEPDTRKHFNYDQATVIPPPSEKLSRPKEQPPPAQPKPQPQMPPRPAQFSPPREERRPHPESTVNPHINQAQEDKKKQKKVLPIVPQEQPAKPVMKIEQPKKENKKSKKIIGF